jgi:hypothetical protein
MWILVELRFGTTYLKEVRWENKYHLPFV